MEKISYHYYLQKYLNTLPDYLIPENIITDTYYFCNNETDANHLAKLVSSGIKRATSSLYWTYESEGMAIPTEGQLDIITNWNKDPVCIIETTETKIEAFGKVDSDFAFEEGEGDKSLKYWRDVHWDFFKKECVKTGKLPSGNMHVVLQKFRVVYK